MENILQFVKKCILYFHLIEACTYLFMFEDFFCEGVNFKTCFMFRRRYSHKSFPTSFMEPSSSRTPGSRKSRRSDLQQGKFGVFYRRDTARNFLFSRANGTSYVYDYPTLIGRACLEEWKKLQDRSETLEEGPERSLFQK